MNWRVKIWGVIISSMLICTIFAAAWQQVIALILMEHVPEVEDGKPALATPTQIVTPTEQHILWSADHETGDLSQWYEDDGGGVFNTGTGSVTVTDTIAHCGQYAIELAIYNAEGQAQAARIFRWLENPEEAYYSAWLFFPQRVESEQWWIVFQFKSGDPVWLLNVGNLENGDMVFYLWDWLNNQTYNTQLPSKSVTIPVGQWIHLEAFYRQAIDKSGRITIWQDGVKLYDLDEVQTALFDYVHWSLANYTDEITPSAVRIYADDAIISTTPIGPRVLTPSKTSTVPPTYGNNSNFTTYLPLIYKESEC